MIIQNVQHISCFTLCIYCWNQAHLPQEDEYGNSWEEGFCAKSIGRAINPCSEYRSAKDNIVITANPTQISNPAHGWGWGKGQMVFSCTERDKEATGRPRKAPELVSVGLGKPHRDLKARSPIAFTWILGTDPMASARQQAAFPKSLLTPK